jgi:integrase
MKKCNNVFRRVEQYVAQRRNLGYRLTTDEGLLLHFAKYVSDSGHQGYLTSDLILRWVKLPLRARPSYLIRRLATVRSFAKYLSIYEPQTEIPPSKVLGLVYLRPAPYIYSEHEIESLLRACSDLRPRNGLRPHTYRTLFALLAVTGLRISEALKLHRDDVDFARGVLIIRDTKFRKSRLVPVHETTREALCRYADRRDRYLPTAKARAFFLSENGSAIPYPTIRGMFYKLRQRLEWEGNKGRKAPRIQDLRHTFVCRRILLWYEQGVDVDQFIPVLSTYLGHAKVTDTYWYLTATPDLLAVTAKRFEQYTQSKKEEIL